MTGAIETSANHADHSECAARAACLLHAGE